MFNAIAKSGYIATPSKYRELSYWECDLNNPTRNGHRMRWLGYIHHRWIFDIINGEYTAFPKLNFIDACPFLKDIGDSKDEVCELNLYWEDSIDLKIMNNGFCRTPAFNGIFGGEKRQIIADTRNRERKQLTQVS